MPGDNNPPASGTATPGEASQHHRGSCHEFNKFVLSNGVVDHNGIPHPAWGAATTVEVYFHWDPKDASVSEEHKLKYKCPITGSVVADRKRCDQQCFSSTGFGGQGPSHKAPCVEVTEYNFTATNITVLFPVPTHVTVLEWDPPSDASPECRAAKAAWDTLIQAHEQHHKSDIDLAVGEAIEQFKKQTFKGSAYSRDEALEDLRRKTQAGGYAAAQALKDEIEKRKDKYHNSAAGQVPLIECNHCK